MPKGLDVLQKKIWNRMRGKINPRTKKPFTESDAWAVAIAQWKKMGKELIELVHHIEKIIKKKRIR